MKNRGRVLFVGTMFAAASLLLDCSNARADAIALSDISASHLLIADRGAGIVTFDPLFQTLALAHAQNSLGELDDESDFEIGIPAATAAAVTWANGSSSSSDTAWKANSNAKILGVDGAANSFGQALWFTTFEIDCPTCIGSTTVDLSIGLSGDLEVQTDPAGLLARTETIFNLLINGDTALFRDDLLTIGSNDHKVLAFGTTLTRTLTLTYGTPYDLVLRADSESEVINAAAPEPASATLLLLGLGTLGAARVRRRRSSATDPS
jgi:hypothetical protein